MMPLGPNEPVGSPETLSTIRTSVAAAIRAATTGDGDAARIILELEPALERWQRNPRSSVDPAELRGLQDDLRLLNRLFGHALQFYAGWAGIAALAGCAYGPDGAAPVVGGPGTVVVEA